MSTDMELRREIGMRLRAARIRRGCLTLSQVEPHSGGTWKGITVGSYERADREPSVTQFIRLCEWLEVPVTDILPDVPRPLALADDRDVPALLEHLAAVVRAGEASRLADLILERTAEVPA